MLRPRFGFPIPHSQVISGVPCTFHNSDTYDVADASRHTLGKAPNEFWEVHDVHVAGYDVILKSFSLELHPLQKTSLLIFLPAAAWTAIYATIPYAKGIILFLRF